MLCVGPIIVLMLVTFQKLHDCGGRRRCGGDVYCNYAGVYSADVDECITGTHQCEAFCHNIVRGSYWCSCPEGYALSQDGANCDSAYRLNVWHA